MSSAHVVSHELNKRFNKLTAPNVCLEHCYVWDTRYESDFAVITPGLFVHEYEIKLTRKDFLQDFKKNYGLKHRYIDSGRSGLATFTFVVRKGLVSIEDIPDHYGFFEFEFRGVDKAVIEEVRKAPRLKNAKGLDSKSIFRIFKNLSYRHHLKNVKEFK